MGGGGIDSFKKSWCVPNGMPGDNTHTLFVPPLNVVNPSWSADCVMRANIEQGAERDMATVCSSQNRTPIIPMKHLGLGVTNGAPNVQNGTLSMQNETPSIQNKHPSFHMDHSAKWMIHKLFPKRTYSGWFGKYSGKVVLYLV